jgi:hypothetical protein
MTVLAAPVRSATGTLALPPHATITLSGAAVLGSQPLTMKVFSPSGREQPMLIILMATTCSAGTLNPAARRWPARTRLAAHRRDERSLSAGHAFAFAGARPVRSGGSAGTGQQHSPAGRRDTPNKRVNLIRSSAGGVSWYHRAHRLRAVRWAYRWRAA